MNIQHNFKKGIMPWELDKKSNTAAVFKQQQEEIKIVIKTNQVRVL